MTPESAPPLLQAHTASAVCLKPSNWLCAAVTFDLQVTQVADLALIGCAWRLPVWSKGEPQWCVGAIMGVCSEALVGSLLCHAGPHGFPGRVCVEPVLSTSVSLAARCEVGLVLSCSVCVFLPRVLQRQRSPSVPHTSGAVQEASRCRCAEGYRHSLQGLRQGRRSQPVPLFIGSAHGFFGVVASVLAASPLPCEQLCCHLCSEPGAQAQQLL